MAEFVVFWIMAPLALGAALSMLFMKNAVHAALMLVLNFFAIAVLYAVLEAQFLAVVQIVVYAGAIMVLFLFVIMLLGVHTEEPSGRALRRLPAVAVTLGVGLFAVLALSVAGTFMASDDHCPTEPTVALDQAPTSAVVAGDCKGLSGINAQGNVRALGLKLFTDYLWPFEVTSVLLVIAAIGAMVIGRKHEKPEDLVDQMPPDPSAPHAPEAQVAPETDGLVAADDADVQAATEETSQA